MQACGSSGIGSAAPPRIMRPFLCVMTRPGLTLIYRPSSLVAALLILLSRESSASSPGPWRTTAWLASVVDNSPSPPLERGGPAALVAVSAQRAENTITRIEAPQSWPGPGGGLLANVCQLKPQNIAHFRRKKEIGQSACLMLLADCCMPPPRPVVSCVCSAWRLAITIALDTALGGHRLLSAVSEGGREGGRWPCLLLSSSRVSGARAAPRVAALQCCLCLLPASTPLPARVLLLLLLLPRGRVAVLRGWCCWPCSCS